jgi:hypothetical protein
MDSKTGQIIAEICSNCSPPGTTPPDGTFGFEYLSYLLVIIISQTAGLIQKKTKTVIQQVTEKITW